MGKCLSRSRTRATSETGFVPSDINQTVADNATVSEEIPSSNGFLAPKHAVEKQIAEAIKFNHKIGLSPFTATDDGDLVSSRARTVACLMYFFWAGIDIIKDIRVDYRNMTLTKDYTVSSLGWLYHVSLLGLLICSFYLIWWCQGLIMQGLQKMYSVTPPTNNKTRLSGIALRVSSILLAAYFTASGSTVLPEASLWSPESILLNHEYYIVVGLIPQSFLDWNENVVNATLVNPAANITSIQNATVGHVDADFYNVTIRGILRNETLRNGSGNTTSAPESDVFNANSQIIVFGTIGLILCFITELLVSDTHDMLFLTSKTIWAFAQDLNVQDLYLTFGPDKRPLISDEDLEIKKQAARALLTRYDEIRDGTGDLNGPIMIFLPALLLASTFKGSNVVQLIFEFAWFKVLYYILKLIKLGPTFYYSVRTSIKARQFKLWFISKSARVLLGLSFEEFQRRCAEMNMKPIGVGSGMFYINSTLLGSLAGLVCSNFYLVLQRWDSLASLCKCKCSQ